MKALAISLEGIEEVTLLEIKELIKAKIMGKEPSAVVFEPKELIDLCGLCYKAQSVSRILYLFDYFDFENKDELLLKIKKIVEKTELEQWLGKENTFKCECDRHGNHDFSSQEIEEETGELIINKIKKDKNHAQKVNLENPDVLFYVYVYENKAYFGIDFSGFDLSKREYKLFGHSYSLKGTLAYALLRLSDYNKKEIISDPFSSSGEILIEAALFSAGFSANYYKKDKFIFRNLKIFKKMNFDSFFKKIDKKINLSKKITLFGFDSNLHGVKNSQKNAKIAGINKQIKFSKVSLEWLDTKFKKNSVDKIITRLPQYSKYINKKDIEKIYQELFYQADYILKQNALITIITKNTEMVVDKASKHKFGVIKEVNTKGNKILVFKKKGL